MPPEPGLGERFKNITGFVNRDNPIAEKGGTGHRGGLLIYASLFEHRLEIRCDKAAAEKLTSEDLEEIRDVVLRVVRKGQVADGLIAGLEKAEERLASALPHTGQVTDTLKNEVLVFHPRP